MQSLLRLYFDLAYRVSKPRWDTGVPPPPLAALAANGAAGKRALDLGCGTGTNAIYLAQHGMTTVGVDYSPKAIELAAQKAKSANVRVDFVVGDVTRLDVPKEPFDLVVDVGCLHSLDAAGRARYAQQLARLVRPGGKFLLWAFEPGAHVGVGIDADEVQQRFGSQFKLTRVEHGTHVPGGRGAAWYWLDCVGARRA